MGRTKKSPHFSDEANWGSDVWGLSQVPLGVRDGTHVVSCSQTSPSSFPIASRSLVWLLSHIWLFATPWTAAHQASLSFTISLSFLKFMSIKSVITIQPSHRLSPPSPLALSFSQHQGLFQWVSYLHQVAKYWSFSISPSNEYSRLISFRIDRFDLLAVQGAFKSFLQHHNSKA